MEFTHGTGENGITCAKLIAVAKSNLGQAGGFDLDQGGLGHWIDVEDAGRKGAHDTVEPNRNFDRTCLREAAGEDMAIRGDDKARAAGRHGSARHNAGTGGEDGDDTWQDG